MKNAVYTNLSKNSIKGLASFLKGFQAVFAVVLLFIGIAVACETGQRYLFKFLIDDVINGARWNLLPWLIAAIIAFAAVRGLVSYFTGRLNARVSEGIALSLRNTIYDHLQKLSFSYHDNAKTGDLIQRATTDVDTIRRFFAEQIPGVFRIICLFIINFSVISWIDIRLALVTIIISPVILIISALFFYRIHKAYMNYEEEDGRVSALLQENLTGVRVVKAFGRQNFESEKFEKLNRRRYRLGVGFTISHTAYWPVSHIICVAQMVICLFTGGTLFFKGSISAGDFIAFITIAENIIWPMQHMGQSIAKLSTAAVSYTRIREILKEHQEDLTTGLKPQDQPVIDTPLRGEFEFDRVTFGYTHDAPVLNKVSFKVNAGENIALIGESGSGKSSLINLILRFYNYEQGDIRLDGRSLTDYSRHFLRQNIGIVEQEPFLFSASIRDNIAFGVERKVSFEEIVEAARVAAIHDSIEGFSEGYNTKVGERGVTLSGGQKQRIALARIILKNPKILILDDSTSAVDADTEHVIRSALKKQHDAIGQRTTFIVAHRLASLETADKILVFHQGAICEEGTHKQLIQKDGFYKKIYTLQTDIEEELVREMDGGVTGDQNHE